MRKGPLLALLLVTACKSKEPPAEEPPPAKAKAKATASTAPSVEPAPKATTARIVARRDKIDTWHLVPVEGEPVPLGFDKKGSATYVFTLAGRLALVKFQADGESAPSLFLASIKGDALYLGPVVERDMTDTFVTATSRDGRTVLLSRSRKGVSAAAAEETVWITKLGVTGPVVRWTGRSSSGGTVSPDGTRALFSGVPSTCTAAWVGNCPFHTFKVDLTTKAPVVEPFETPKVGAAYQPRFHPTDPETVYLQSTVTVAEGCTDVNHCRHDLVARSFTKSEPARLVRKNAYGIAFSPSGAVWTFLSLEGSACTSLPCQAAALYVGKETDLPREPVGADVAVFGVRSLSPDELTFGYRGTEGGPSGTTGLVIRSVSGKKLRFLDGYTPFGWL
ncbi:MAG: hypothetical protein JNL79_26030 [Myxococcales bacterium]|nr:hypothetical protein [Myxococcales bacterium]